MSRTENYHCSSFPMLTTIFCGEKSTIKIIINNPSQDLVRMSTEKSSQIPHHLSLFELWTKYNLRGWMLKVLKNSNYWVSDNSHLQTFLGFQEFLSYILEKL